MGCIFYELLTLKYAFDGDTIDEIAIKIKNCNYEEVDSSNENYDLDLEIVKK